MRDTTTGRRLTRRETLALFGGATLAAALPACRREPAAPPAPAAPAAQPALADDLHYRSLLEIARLLESGALSPLELTERMLARIEALDSGLQTYATVMPERALAAARQAEREIAAGRYRGPLHGIPIAVKDLCYTRGTRTMGGMAAYRDFVPDFDATVVSRLETAGAVLLGKLNLTEGAMAGYHPDFAIPVNPWGERLWAGASSSGSGAATAASLCFAALGSDTGGSIRFPAMANGIVGLKPTYGRVSRHGVLPLAESMDHVGPMTRRTADAAAVLQAMAGHDPADPTSLNEPAPDLLSGIDAGVRGLRLGYDPLFSGEGIDRGLVAAIEQALDTLASLGAEIVELSMPPGSRAVGDMWFPICAYEAHRAHAEVFAARPGDFGPFMRHFLEIGAAMTEEQYLGASQLRADYSRGFATLLGQVDAVVCPAGGLTFELDRELLYGGNEELEPLFGAVQMYFTIPADFAGTPALTVPCGWSAGNVPYALQFMGSRLSEAMLCRIGHAYEQATEWHARRPPGYA